MLALTVQVFRRDDGIVKVLLVVVLIEGIFVLRVAKLKEAPKNFFFDAFVNLAVVAINYISIVSIIVQWLRLHFMPGAYLVCKSWPLLQLLLDKVSKGLGVSRLIKVGILAGLGTPERGRFLFVRV